MSNTTSAYKRNVYTYIIRKYNVIRDVYADVVFVTSLWGVTRYLKYKNVEWWAYLLIANI